MPSGCAAAASMSVTTEKLSRPYSERLSLGRYNLATPQSDEDYHFVYLTPARQLLSLAPCRSHFESHGLSAFGSDKAGELECSGVELGEYVQRARHAESQAACTARVRCRPVGWREVEGRGAEGVPR